MNTAETIKAAREQLRMTQEDLAEKLSVSRQAVSKWEMGLSVPSTDNLRLLSDVLGVDLSAAEGSSPAPVPPVPGSRWKYVALALGLLCVLMTAALLTLLLHPVVSTEKGGTPSSSDTAVIGMGGALPAPEAAETAVTGVYFFDEDGKALRPDLGDGWCAFSPGSRVWMEVTFRENTDASVYAVSLFLTPTGTETFDLREQLAVQSVPDGRGFALFPLDISRDLMGHLDILLECAGGRTVTETLNVAAKLE